MANTDTLDYRMPWTDLKDRLDGANDNLRVLFRSARGENALRLAWKREAIENAHDAHEDLHRKVLRADITAEDAWREFTSRVANLYNVTDAHPGYYEGVSLALSFQRGYAPEIDVPVIPNPHTKHI